MFGGQTRCIVGDVQMENRASSRLWVLAVIVGVKEKGVISKGTGGCPAFIICHCGRKIKVAFTTWQLHFFHPPRDTHVRKTTTKKPSLMSVGLKPRLSLSVTSTHKASSLILGSLQFTDTLCADDIGLFVSSKSTHQSINQSIFI